MAMTRREILLASLGLAISGCAGRRSERMGSPTPAWTRATPAKPVYAPPPPPVVQAPVQMVPGFKAIPRSSWTRSGPIRSKINPMNGVKKITVHHEGSKPYWSADTRTTAARLEQIRRVHVNDRGWADIGYHYIIDRTGKVWQGRDIRYQGAHVKDNNEHNLGVLVLGNFEQQSPSKDQIDKLGYTLRDLMRIYKVPVTRVKTHREINPTACPGRHLQPIVVKMRSSGYLA